jgi:hypothetical protein
MKKPRTHTSQVENKGIAKVDSPKICVGKPTKQFVVVPRDVVYFGPLLGHGDQPLDYFKMALREVGFLEVPNVNNVAIEN